MKTIRFKVDGRTASLVDSKYEDAVREAFSFSVPSARYTPAHKLWLQQKALGVPEEERQGWNGKHSMMTHGEVPIGLLLGAESDLEKMGYKVAIAEWKHRPKVEEQEGFVEKDINYHYQNIAVDKMRLSVRNGGGLVLSATGTGKTKAAAQFFSWIKGHCLFVVDQIDLLYQSQAEINNWLVSNGYDNEVGVIGNGKFDPKRITIATIQTLHKQKNSKRFKEWAKHVEVIMIDEIHVQMARRNFSVIDKIDPKAVIGLTATMQLRRKPVRFKCYSICGPMVFEFPIHKGVEAGVLSQGVVVQAEVPENDEPIVPIKVKGKWKTDTYSHEVVLNSNLHDATVKLVKACLKEDLCTVVLVERIRHLKKLKSRLANYDPQIFYGEIKVADRKKQLKRFDAGKENLIIANRVFTKGINLKRIDVVIDCAQRKNKDDCMQKFGRAVRLHTEKAGIYYFDLFTAGKLEKAAKSRHGAFKKAKIPISILNNADPKVLLKEADKLLTAALRKNKEASAQGGLF